MDNKNTAYYVSSTLWLRILWRLCPLWVLIHWLLTNTTVSPWLFSFRENKKTARSWTSNNSSLTYSTGRRLRRLGCATSSQRMPSPLTPKCQLSASSTEWSCRRRWFRPRTSLPTSKTCLKAFARVYKHPIFRNCQPTTEATTRGPVAKFQNSSSRSCSKPTKSCSKWCLTSSTLSS